MDRKPLQTWVHPSHRVVLLGDACHPMLARLFSFPLLPSPLCGTHASCLTVVVVSLPQPYRAQGAAMALEDAAVLGALLARLAHPAELAPLLRAYEDLRRPRTAETQRQSRMNRRIFHLGDGPEQERRDAEMRRAARAEEEEGRRASYAVRAEGREGREGKEGREGREHREAGNANQWADEDKNVAQFGYDADEAVERWWREGGEKLVRAAS